MDDQIRQHYETIAEMLRGRRAQVVEGLMGWAHMDFERLGLDKDKVGELIEVLTSSLAQDEDTWKLLLSLVRATRYDQHEERKAVDNHETTTPADVKANLAERVKRTEFMLSIPSIH